jgi:cell division protein FtsW (lipid II flippase)
MGHSAAVNCVLPDCDRAINGLFCQLELFALRHLGLLTIHSTGKLFGHCLALAAAVVMSFFDYHRLNKWVLPMMALTIGMLVLVLLVDDTPMAPKRTFLNGSVQPSELAKLAMIIYLAAWLYSKRDQINNI